MYQCFYINVCLNVHVNLFQNIKIMQAYSNFKGYAKTGMIVSQFLNCSALDFKNYITKYVEQAVAEVVPN